MRSHEITISYLLWFRLMGRLRRRGRGVRESGAFLLGKIGAQKVSEFICYDDLDPHALDTGIIDFDGAGYGPLWERCERRKMHVLADVHTHPGAWTGQSGSDRAYPMISQPGHVALIVPHYATRKGQTSKGVGVHEYLGDHEWKSGRNATRVSLTLF